MASFLHFRLDDVRVGRQRHVCTPAILALIVFCFLLSVYWCSNGHPSLRPHRLLRKYGENWHLQQRHSFQKSSFLDPKTISTKVSSAMRVPPLARIASGSIAVPQKAKAFPPLNETALPTAKRVGPRVSSRELGSCAVVFSSGSLLKYDDGPIIDSFDEVIRINGAIPDGFERHVGHRTTHWLVHFGIFHNSNYSSPGEWFALQNNSNWTGITLDTRSPREVEGYAKWHTRTASNWLLVPMAKTISCIKFVGLGKNQICSSGMMIALWAVDNCRSVTVFGREEDPCYPYHFNMPKPLNCSRVQGFGDSDFQFNPRSYGHSIFREHLVLEQMHIKGRLTINRNAAEQATAARQNLIGWT